MLDPESCYTIAKAQQQERLFRARQRRDARRATRRHTTTRRIAQLLGHLLGNLSARLLRYSGAETPALLRLEPPAQYHTSRN